MKSLYKYAGLSLLSAAVVLSSCSDSFVDPDPLSFFEPTATFTTASGLAAALGQCDRQFKVIYTDGGNDMFHPIHTQYIFSDILLNSATDKTRTIKNFSTDLTPSRSTLSSGTQLDYGHSIGFLFRELYNGVKYANTIIEFAPKVQGLDQATLNAYIGRAYFHRAWRYYSLVNSFGDIPLVSQMPKGPKLDYTSTSREAILQMLQEDMEKAVEWVPDQTPGSYSEAYPGGFVNKGACRMLLAKIYLANYEYAKAKEQLDILIDQSGYSLMKTTFGTNILNEQKFPGLNTWKVTRNVIWDLNRAENVFDPANKETILGLPNAGTKILKICWLRGLAPFIFNNATTDPSGKQALTNYNLSNCDPENDWVRVMGRGVASYRPTTWFQHDLWTIDGNLPEEGDLRHSHKMGNWLRMEDMTYNTKGSEWYGKHLQLYSDDGKLLCSDTIRRWYDYPLYKLYMYDDDNYKNKNTGEWRGAQGEEAVGHLYMYRLAEAYLLRAEAKLYMGLDGTDDVNEIRRRAQCDQLYKSITIDDIFDERARELYNEEWRHDELVRASYCLANTGIADRRGIVYTLEEVKHPSGDDTDKNGGSFWYQRTIGTCPDQLHIGYNNGVVYSITASNAHPTFIMGKHNIFWPIPEWAIQDNSNGTLAQNYGYTGYNPNIKVYTDWHDAVADELK